MNLYERSLKVLAPVAKRATQLGVQSGQGSYLIDENGRKILDFASGVAVCNIGHNHPKVVEAIHQQVDELIHAGHNVVYYESYVKLAERLTELNGPDSMVYFSNSGAEANDGAIKLAKYVTKRKAIISFKNSFHGRTIGAMSLTASSSAYRKYYTTLPDIYYLDYPNVYKNPLVDGQLDRHFYDQFTELFNTLVDPYDVAAIILEPVQGEGGYVVPPKAFLEYVRSVCDEYGILLIFDEVQTGFGRTGKLFASQVFGVEPDIRTVAKGIASGLPLSAILAKKDLMLQWSPGAHGGTFGGNPVACAAGLATLDVLLDGAIDNAAKQGEYFKAELEALKEEFDSIVDVRGVGLMIGMEIETDGQPDAAKTAQILKKSLEKGLLLLSCGTAHNVVRFIAPTTVSESEIDEAIAILKSVLTEITAENKVLN